MLCWRSHGSNSVPVKLLGRFFSIRRLGSYEDVIAPWGVAPTQVCHVERAAYRAAEKCAEPLLWECYEPHEPPLYP
jgi:hypothetical protein